VGGGRGTVRNRKRFIHLSSLLPRLHESMLEGHVEKHAYIGGGIRNADRQSHSYDPLCVAFGIRCPAESGRNEAEELPLFFAFKAEFVCPHVALFEHEMEIRAQEIDHTGGNVIPT
jgi:hypothetical protein